MSWTITGRGAVCAVGGDVAETFAALCAGRSGLAALRGFDPARFRARNAYEIDDRPPAGDVPLRASRWLERAVAAALADAGMGEDLGDVPVLVGTTLRELRSVELSWRDGVPFDVRDLHFGAALRRRFDAVRTFTVANACSASLYALGLGVDLLELGEADTVVVAGVDAITESTYGLLDRCYPEPPDRIRPFDRARRGMLQGEGACAVVVRREDGRAGRPPDAGPDASPAGAAADAPGRPVARIRGVAMNCDAHHPSAPHSGSIGRTIREAHERAGVAPSDIDLLMLHGTGTPLNDEAEARAVGGVFGAAAGRPHMTAIKSMVGHTAGASGLHSLVTAVESLRAGVVPPILGLADPIPEVAGFRLVRDRAARAPLERAQVNSFGFGGLNAVAIVEKVV